MNYRDYIDLSREELLEKVASAMSEKRFRHVLGVEQVALDLAERYGCDATKASLAALLQDTDAFFLEILNRKK